MENKGFQGPVGIFKAMDRRAGLRCLTQQKTQQGRIKAFLLRHVRPLCTEHIDAYSTLNIAARASQWKKVHLGPVKVCTELWRQFQALFLFHAFSTNWLLPVASVNMLLPLGCPCSFPCGFCMGQHSAINSDFLETDFT